MIVKKSDLPRLANLRGVVNDAPYTIGDCLHRVGELKFMGFVGRHMGDDRYDGKLVFECVEADIVYRSCSFSDEMRALPDNVRLEYHPHKYGKD